MTNLLIAAAAAASQSAATAEAPVALPPQIAAHVPANLRSYYLVFLVDPATPKEMSTDLFVRHQAYIREKFSQGVFRVAGPLTDGGRVRGITILAAASIDEARAIASGDPAVQEKVLAVEVHPAVFPDLSGIKVAYPPKGK